MINDPVTRPHQGEFPAQSQDQPGLTERTVPKPDHGEESYVGSGKLRGNRALITGGDSGIGRAVAIAFAREGADLAISHMRQEQLDAEETQRWVMRENRCCAVIAADLREEGDCLAMVERAVEVLGGLDVLVLNAGYQKNRNGLESLSTAEMDRVFKTNLYGSLWVARTAVPHLKPGASIIITSSIQASSPTPDLLDYAMTKAALVAFTQALALELTPRGIRVNAVAPGPIWTPLIPGTQWEQKLETFGQSTPLGRAGQPAEVASAYVFLASAEASYVSGAVVPVTGGRLF